MAGMAIVIVMFNKTAFWKEFILRQNYMLDEAEASG
jgi:hypothetical protein